MEGWRDGSGWFAASRVSFCSRLPDYPPAHVYPPHGHESPPSLLDSIPQGGPNGRTMVAGSWRRALSSKEAEKDILILETNGTSSVVEAHRPNYYCNPYVFL